jgi:hypothetical protein
MKITWLILGVVGGLAIAGCDPDKIEKSDDKLQEVQGAMGWNLGDVLPNNFQVNTNDTIYGITYQFDPPPELKNDLSANCFLILTEDRRIAAIRVHGGENEHFDFLNIKKVLKEKYGVRQIFHDQSSGNIIYFGDAKRQVVLSTNILGACIDLNYQDKQLNALAETQQEIRKAAAKEDADKQTQTNLKGKF